MNITDGTNTLQVYAGHTADFNLPDDWETESYDMVGVLGVYNTTNQIMPTGIMKNGKIVTGIKEICNDIISIKYYDIMGRVANKPHDGINIMVIKYANGTSKTIKVLQ